MIDYQNFSIYTSNKDGIYINNELIIKNSNEDDNYQVKCSENVAYEENFEASIDKAYISKDGTEIRIVEKFVIDNQSSSDKNQEGKITFIFLQGKNSNYYLYKVKREKVWISMEDKTKAVILVILVLLFGCLVVALDMKYNTLKNDNKDNFTYIGYWVDDEKEGENEEIIARDLKERLSEGTLMIAHNTQFDLMFIYSLLKNVEIKKDYSDNDRVVFGTLKKI